MTIRFYHDFIIFTDDLEKDEYERVKSFSVRVFDSPVGQGEKKETVIVPDDLIHRSRRLENRELDADIEQQIKLGELLAGLLLPKYARELFGRSLAWLRDDEGIRLRLRLADELVALPWEYMYIQDMRGERTPSSFLALDPRISIVRHEALAMPAEWFAPSDKRRIVVAMATPHPYSIYPKLDNLPREQKLIRDALSEVAGIDVEYLPLYNGDYEGIFPGATVKDVITGLMKPTDIFHFSGHGEFVKSMGPGAGSLIGQGAILLAGEDNEAVPLPADHLMELLRSRGVNLVVLGACETGRRDIFNVWSSVAASLLKGGISAVIAMQFSIKDDLAPAFMGTLYEALVAGLAIDEAVALGRAAIRAKALDGRRNIRDWGVPVLYLRAPGGRIFNPVSDETARQAAEKKVSYLFKQHITTVASTGRVIGAAIDDVQVDKVEVIQKVEKDVSGLMIGGYVVNFKGDRIFIQQDVDTVTGALIGAILSSKNDWVKLDELLKAYLPATTTQPQPHADEETIKESKGIGQTCPKCHAPVEATWKFCPNCKAKLSFGPGHCTQCDAKLTANAKFCPQCGTKVR